MRPLAALALVLLASLASPQTVADALRGGARPIPPSELPEGYRAVALSGGDGLGGAAPLFLMGLGGGGGDGDPKSRLLFSLMGASFVDPDEFAALLDGKRPRIRAYALDLGAMMAAPDGGASTPPPVFVETWIEAGRIVQWSPRPALTKAAIVAAFGTARLAAEATAGLSNVKQIATGMMLYASDWDERFPVAGSTAQAQKLVGPYVKNDALWRSPNGGRVLYNTALSGVSQTSLQDIAGTLLVWEESVYADGKRAVGFTDGHVRLADRPTWSQLWATETQRRDKAMLDGPPRARARPAGSSRPRR